MPRASRPGRPLVDAAPEVEKGAKPFLKWAGGKWSLVRMIQELLPRDLEQRTYREPFLGGGALFFWLRNLDAAKRYVLSDSLQDLITAYEVVRDQPEELIRELERLKQTHSADEFYRIRDRYNDVGNREPLNRAAWLVYLNKTCFNGLYRTNRSGLFNVPLGRFDKPNIADAPRLRAATVALRGKDVTISCNAFDHLRQTAKSGDVIYFDPPYIPVSATSNFDSYSGGAFGGELQEKLRDLFHQLDQRGCLLVLSNSAADKVYELYEGFDIQKLEVTRHISSRTSTRGTVSEVVVRNLKSWPTSARQPAKSSKAAERAVARASSG